MYFIEIKTYFTGFHRWLKAPKEVKFLRSWHRHLFEVEASFEVDHHERAKEFFITKARLDKYLKKNFEGKYFEFSCELIAEKIALNLNCDIVLVREDNENAGVFKKDNL